MKIRNLLTALAFSLGLVGLMLGGASAAQPTRIDLSGTIANSCAPQDGPISYQGTAQFVQTSSGNVNVIVKVSGVSATGVKYQISETIHASTGADGSFSQTVRLHLVSQGSSDNWFVSSTFSYDPINGYQYSFDTACRG